MPLEKQRRKNEIIDELVDRVRGRVEESQEEAATFVRHFYAQIRLGDLLEESRESLVDAALSIWRFASQRPLAAVPKVRLYNPRLRENGWDSAHTIVEIVNDDMPFLVDSIAGALHREEACVRRIIHPVVRVDRDDEGRIVRLFDDPDFASGSAIGGTAESWMQVVIEDQFPDRHEKIRAVLEEVLAEVRQVVGDWQAMRRRLAEIIDELETSPPAREPEEVAEGLAFLRWLNEDHFTYLGAREYRFEGRGATAVAHVVADRGLGLLADPDITVFDGLRHLGRLPREVQHFVRQPHLLRITKANRRSRVHRNTYMDTVAIKSFDDDGNVAGERLFLGLFTSAAYAESVLEIPILRQRATRIVRRSAMVPSSHDGRALLHVLETYPRDELFQIAEDELLETATDILQLQDRQRITLFVRRDPFERFVSCLVYVPRDRFDTALRLKLQELTATAYRGEVVAYYTHLSEAALARVHFIVKTQPGEVPDVDVALLESRLIEAGHSWDARLEGLIAARCRAGEELRRLRRYVRSFPAAYRELYDEGTALLDIESIEQAIASGDMALRLYRRTSDPESEVQLKMFTAGGALPLSDVIPMLENMGLRVIDEMPFDIQVEEPEERICIRDFHLSSEQGEEIDLDRDREHFYEAFAQVWRREIADDRFNRLVLGAGLEARQVTVLRAYSRYLQQVGTPFSQRYMAATLSRNPDVARRLVDLFLVRFRPQPGLSDGVRASAEAEIVEEIGALLDRIDSLDEDRIIRRLLNLIRSTVRTNFFQSDGDGKAKRYLAIKLDSTRIEELPSPRPYREIWVYSPRFEGVHLRGGAVARGGIRWSDRRQDFRTEILGLMKAQMTKNAIIVPVGAKGGFVVRDLPTDVGGQRAAVAECYRMFIRGLLDLTDNRRDDGIVPPPQVVRHDGDDAYLVVAADRGTATFSDVANEVAAEYDFWLDDAFASGGSAGYDHKRMGITARGAWESVQRHFRELGKDIQQQDFTVVGVGDMSGDVFGNGMLLSRHIRLLAAFNHRHIFVDPDPEPERSFAERQRLFDSGGGWLDYDRDALSPGGDVFDRFAKSITLSSQARRRFSLDAKTIAPHELIRVLLRAEVELLWFGGIGTFVKASDESDAEVGDRPNDAVRVAASEVRGRVVGEGANLGMTQLARIELARAGGRVNTDFIDNSGGVACSDREVNIKILLGDIERSGELTRSERDGLLASMQEEVTDLVLRGSYLQTQTLTVTDQLGAHLLDRLARVMRGFERRQRLDRGLEFLPDDETIEERMNRREGFTRPEIAVLLSYAKNELYDELVASDLAAEPYLDEELRRYFPSRLRQRFADRIPGHRLRREIVATTVANEMLDRAGLGFVQEVQEKTGRGPSDVARAFLIAREVLDLEHLWRQIEDLDSRLIAATQAAMLVECGRSIERATVWLLRAEGDSLDVADVISRYRDGVAEVRRVLPQIVSGEDASTMIERRRGLEEAGVPDELAARLAAQPILVPAWDVVRLVARTSLPLEPVARLFFAVGSRFGFDWLRRAASSLPADNAWDKLALSSLLDDLFGHQSELVARILSSANGDVDGALEFWTRRHHHLVARTDQLLTELQSVGKPKLSMLEVANRQLEAMSG